MSIFAAFGAAPSNFTVPLTDATVAGSMRVAAGTAVDAAGAAGGSSASFLPHPAKRARPGKTQIAIHFLVFMMGRQLASKFKTHGHSTRGHVQRPYFPRPAPLRWPHA